MKVILSRKGMDSKAGGIPSPILPDGTLLSFPIPDGTSGIAYEDLYYKNHSYAEIIRQLSPNFDFSKNPTCHLDPDIYDGLGGRMGRWNPAYGQCGASASHLDTMDVGQGDLFLFYGMFKQTEYRQNGELSYVRGTPIQHIIYGYMKIGEILHSQKEMCKLCPHHPHSVNPHRANNRLYLPDTYGTFMYRTELVLTKPGQDKRRLWALPSFFAENDISISWQGKNRPILCGKYAELLSACIGQEFVITANTEDMEKKLEMWVDSLINCN